MLSWRLMGLSFLVFLSALTSAQVRAEDADMGSYPLDAIARVLADGEDLPCAERELIVYRGTTLKLSTRRGVRTG